MAFLPQQPTVHVLEEVDNLRQVGGPGMLWTSEQDVNFDLHFNQSFDLTQQTNAFDFQNELAASSVSPYSFSPFVHVPISQTGPPFRATKSQVSDFRKYLTDDQVSGRKSTENIAVGRTYELAQGPLSAIQFGVNQLRVIPDALDNYQHESRSRRQTYQEFMPKPITPQQAENPAKMDELFSVQSEISVHQRRQEICHKRSRKRPRKHGSALRASMRPPENIPRKLPGLSITTSTLNSTVDEIVSDHAAAVIENWLHHFPTVHIPTDDDFKALAILTRLRVETVRIWFGQKLRKQPTELLTVKSDSMYQSALPNMNTSVIREPSKSLFAQSSVQVSNQAAHQATLREAARWVRERGTKCIASPEPGLLRRYEPRPYQCTVGCGKNFDKRADWKRHEEINYPQEGWLCQEMACSDKSLSDPGKISYRKDKFTQHFNNAHAGIDCGSHLDKDHFHVASRFPRKCGFCDNQQFNNWQDRMTHIGDHFSNDKYDMTRWRLLEDEEEAEEDDRSNDEDDGGFDESHNDQTDGFARDFDWHDHDHDNDDNAFSDFSEEDSHGFSPDPAPKKRAQTRNEEALTVSGLEWPNFTYQKSNLVHDMEKPISNRTQLAEALCIKQSLPQRIRRKQLGKAPVVLSKFGSLPPKFLQTRFTRIRVLGLGPYSVVDEVHDRITGNTLARKTVHYTTQRTFKALEAEVDIMKKLKHPHIVRFVGEYSADHSLSILMTPSADFDLDYLMSTDANEVDTPTVSQWFSCLVSTLDYLHSNSIKHQDIKPSNILIRGTTIFLADFGVAKTFNEFDATTYTSGNMTRKYCSPETARHGWRGRKSDIFSLGCVFLEMLSFLLNDDGTSFRDYQWENFVGDGVFHENLSPLQEWLDLLLVRAANQPTELDLSEIIKSCKKMMEIDPRDRPSAEELAASLAPGACCELSSISREFPMHRRHHSRIALPVADHSLYDKRLPASFAIQISSDEKEQQLTVDITSLAKSSNNSVSTPREPSASIFGAVIGSIVGTMVLVIVFYQCCIDTSLAALIPYSNFYDWDADSKETSRSGEGHSIFAVRRLQIHHMHNQSSRAQSCSKVKLVDITAEQEVSTLII